MKKTSLFDSLKSRKFRFGGYATLLIVAGLAIIIAINVLVDQIPGKLDLTQNKIYSLSPETYKLLDGLNTDLTVTTIGKAGTRGRHGEDDPRQVRRAQPSHEAADHRPRDEPGLDQAVRSHAARGSAAGTLVVASGSKYKTIGVYDMYNYDTSNYDPTNPNSQPQLTSLSVEQRVTSAAALRDGGEERDPRTCWRGMASRPSTHSVFPPRWPTRTTR